MRQIHNSSNIFHVILSLFHYFDFIKHIHFCSPIFSNPLTIFSQSSRILSQSLTIFSKSYVLPKIFLKSLSLKKRVDLETGSDVHMSWPSAMRSHSCLVCASQSRIWFASLRRSVQTGSSRMDAKGSVAMMVSRSSLDLAMMASRSS